MAIGPWILINDFKLNVYKKKFDLSADTIKVGLAASTSNLAATLTPAGYANITNELATSGGYTAGGYTVSSPTLTGGGATGTITFDTNNATWTGSSGGFAARFAFIYDDTAASKNIIAYCLLDATPADVTVAAGVTFTLTIADVFAGA